MEALEKKEQTLADPEKKEEEEEVGAAWTAPGG